jgi:hypothetical protein
MNVAFKSVLVRIAKHAVNAVAMLALVCAPHALGQTSPSAFADTTYNFTLTPVTLPSLGTTLAGMETDVLINLTKNNNLGETTLISSSPFIGGRYERVFPSVATWLQTHTNFTGGNFQAGLTVSLGVVKADKERWGERAGVFLKYAPNGATNFNVGLDVEANNLPGIAHWQPSIAVGPNFRF